MLDYVAMRVCAFVEGAI